MALLFHVVAVAGRVAVLIVALAKALLDKAIEVLLIMFVRIVEGSLNALHEHVTDGMQCLLDVIIKLPGRLRNGLLSKVLDESFHLGDIAMAHGSQEILCCRGSLQCCRRGQDQRSELHVD
jgi:hypothetical protein